MRVTETEMGGKEGRGRKDKEKSPRNDGNRPHRRRRWSWDGNYVGRAPMEQASPRKRPTAVP